MFRVPESAHFPTFDNTFKVSFWRWLTSSKVARHEWRRRRNVAAKTAAANQRVRLAEFADAGHLGIVEPTQTVRPGPPWHTSLPGQSTPPPEMPPWFGHDTFAAPIRVVDSQQPRETLPMRPGIVWSAPPNDPPGVYRHNGDQDPALAPRHVDPDATTVLQRAPTGPPITGPYTMLQLTDGQWGCQWCGGTLNAFNDNGRLRLVHPRGASCPGPITKGYVQ